MIKHEIIINEEENHYTKIDFVHTHFSAYETWKDYLVIEHQGTEIYVEMNRYEARKILEKLLDKIIKM